MKATGLQSLWTLVGCRGMHAYAAERPGTSDPPVVLVHGFGVSGRYLLPTAQRLSPSRSVYVPELPGFGRSPGPRRALSIEELADTLAEWMAALGIDRPALLGNSVGCQIIAELAAREHAAVDRLILVGPAIDPYARTRLRQMWAVVRDALREPLSLSWLVARDFLSTGPRRLRGTLTHALDHRFEDCLPRVRCPVLIAHAAGDPFVSDRWADEAARLAPGGRLIVMPDVTHTMNYTAPDKLLAAIAPFLDAATEKQ